VGFPGSSTDPTPRGVVLTFSVSRPDVAGRLGFPAPPAPLRPCDLDLGVFHRAAMGRLPFPWFTAHGLALTLEDPVCVLVRAAPRRHEHDPMPCEPPPVELSAPPTHPARGIHFPTRALRKPGSRRSQTTAQLMPRRGLPKYPLRSAFAVSHGLDGSRLPEPCGLFQPLTPMGLVLPAPGPRPKPRCPVQKTPRGVSQARPGGGSPAKGSRSKRRPGRFSRPGSRSTAPTAETMGPAPAPLLDRYRTPMTRLHRRSLSDLDARVGHRNRFPDRCQPASRSARSAETKRTRPKAPARGCPSRKVTTCNRRVTADPDRVHRETAPRGTACAHDRRSSRTSRRSRLLTSPPSTRGPPPEGASPSVASCGQQRGLVVHL
jgi:hypothetical protein